MYDPKFAHRKLLDLSWEEVAIAQLVAFKKQREIMRDTIFFQISPKGIYLEAHSLEKLETVESRIRDFFTAKVEIVDLRRPTHVVEQLVKDIKDLTKRLREKNDCPYVNLVTN
jgi:hypothetical protein